MQQNLDDFPLPKNLYKEVSCTNMKQNQLLKISSVRPVVIKTRKCKDSQELHENEPKLGAFGMETNLYVFVVSFLASSFFHSQIISSKLLSVFQGFPHIYWPANVHV